MGQPGTRQSSAGCGVTEETAGAQGHMTVTMSGFRLTSEICLQFVELTHKETLMATNGLQPLNCLSQQMEAAGLLTPMTMGRKW